MADNFFKVKNGVNLPTLSADPTVTPPANSAAGDMAFYNGKLYIHNGTAWGVKPGSGSTGLIVNADVDSAAAIAGTKIDPSFGAQNVTTTGTVTVNGSASKLTVDVSSVAEAVYIRQLGTGNALVIADDNSGIGGTDPSVTIIDASGNVGIGVAANATLANKLEVLGNAQVTGNAKVVTGNVTLDSNQGIESHTAASSLNVGTGSNTSTVNIGTGSNTQTVNIGTGAGATTINIGGSGDNVVIAGTLTTVNTTNLDIADKNITLNKGGTDTSANGAGISIEGTSGSTAASLTYAKTDGSAQPQDAFTFSGTGAVAVSSGTTAQRPNTPANGMIRYNSTLTAFEGYAANTWSAIGGGGTVDKVTQASHGFVVGDVLYLNGSTYAKAQADTAAKAEVVGMVSRVVDASNFELTLNGEVSGLSGLTMGEVYFLSPTSAGTTSITEPTAIGQISLPVGVASGTTTMYVMPKRGVIVGSANARTQISLSNNATTNVQSVAAYDAGGIAGWVSITAGVNYRFYVQAQFAKNGAGTDYNLAYQTTGDTPPAGFSVSVTAAGQIQATLPSIAGFSSAAIQYALNAPAVGVTLPLSVDSSLVQFSTVQAKDTSGISVKNAAGSTTNVFVSDAGNVGIGTSSPGGKLNIATPAPAAASTALGLRYSFGTRAAEIALTGSSYSAFGVGSNEVWNYVSADCSALTFGSEGPIPIKFVGNGVERARIDASGNLLVGTQASATNTHQFQGTTNAVGTPVAYFKKPGVAQNASGNTYLEFYSVGNAYEGYLGISGTTLQVIDASDSRKKENVRPASYGLQEVLALNPVTYDWKEEFGGQKDIKGFLAQEVKEVLPECVQIKDDSEHGGFEDSHFLGTATMIPVLVAAIKEQQAQIESLRAELEALKGRA